MRAVGYFREVTTTPRSSIGQQNRRFLDYCEDQGFEVAATFSEDGKQTTNAFVQLLKYLKEPEKGFLLVVTPAPANFAEDKVVAAARCLQVELLGARVQFMDDDGDAMSARSKLRIALPRSPRRKQTLP